MSAEKAIRDAIVDHGPITFAEFMQIALYGPGGYYSSGFPVSADGDYFTGPAAHPLFGALIAVQLRQMWRLLGSPGQFTVVEEGAGNGGLAADITAFAKALDRDFTAALTYHALDIAPPDRQHQPVLPLSEAPEGITGCVLSNELLDAMPVHRFELRGGEVFEIFVSADDDSFVEVLGPTSIPLTARRLEPFIDRLPDRYRGEVNAGLETWADRQAKTLERGWVLTVDYGSDRSTLYRPERQQGSLRTYYQHTLGQEPLIDPGSRDITAHVDFTAVDEAMTAAGFRPLGTVTQAEFLVNNGLESAMRQLLGAELPRPVKRASEMAVQSLVDPGGMGNFVVVAHSKNVEGLTLPGFGGAEPAQPPDFSATGVPLPDPERHIDLTGPRTSGRYFEVESFDDLFRE